MTLPRLVGPQAAMELLYTGRRVSGDEAHALGLCDRLVAADRLREEGKLRFLGFSTHTPNLVNVVETALDSGRFDVMVLAWALNENIDTFSMWLGVFVFKLIYLYIFGVTVC